MPPSGSAERKKTAERVVALPVERDDAALLGGLRRGEAWAIAALFDRHARGVERVIRRVLGYERHTELADLVHEVFVQAISSARTLRDGDALGAWLRGIAVHTACRAIRYRKARRWLRFYEPEKLPEQAAAETSEEAREAFVHTYAVLERMPAADRALFALRHIDGMQVPELALSMDVSISTIKRRLTRAEQRFAKLARRDPVLCEWLSPSGRRT